MTLDGGNPVLCSCLEPDECRPQTSHRMDIAGLQEALHKQPFEPFSIRMADGRQLPVPHPDFLAVAPHRVVLIGEDGSWSVLEPRLIASLDYLPARNSPPPIS